MVVGVDKALVMLRHCCGYFDEEGQFVETWQHLKVDAVQDGSMVYYDGDPARIQPVLRVRGRYHDFALLETPMLGILGRASRIATNVYETMVAARGKPVLFFPARFDVHEVQAADGYAYDMAVQRFAMDRGEQTRLVCQHRRPGGVVGRPRRRDGGARGDCLFSWATLPQRCWLLPVSGRPPFRASPWSTLTTIR